MVHELDGHAECECISIIHIWMHLYVQGAGSYRTRKNSGTTNPMGSYVNNFFRLKSFCRWRICSLEVGADPHPIR